MAGQLGIFSPMTVQFGAYGAYTHAVSQGWAGLVLELSASVGLKHRPNEQTLYEYWRMGL